MRGVEWFVRCAVNSELEFNTPPVPKFVPRFLRPLRPLDNSAMIN